MSSKQVGIALHKHFYIRFFESYNDLLDKFTKISYHTNFDTIDLKQSIKKIKVMYSTYSHYLKEHDEDTYLKDLIAEQLDLITEDKQYKLLVDKCETSIGTLNFEELCTLNISHNKHLNNVLEVFGIFCNSFADSDLFPKLTRNAREHEKAVAYAVYDVFYESFYKLHSTVQQTLDEFNIVKFNETFKLILVFFYGYSYYLQKDTIKVIKDHFNDLIKYYNDKDFLFAYFNLIQGNLNEKGIKIVKEYNTELLNKFIDINELINNDLPKTNMFPKRYEKIVIDTTLV